MTDEHTISQELAAMEDHEITIVAKLPGNEKSTTQKFMVKARSNTEALVKGEEVWRQAVEPQDIRVRKCKITVGS